MFPLVFNPPPSFRQCIALFAVAKGWLFFDIGWCVLFLQLIRRHTCGYLVYYTLSDLWFSLHRTAYLPNCPPFHQWNLYMAATPLVQRNHSPYNIPATALILIMFYTSRHVVLCSIAYTNIFLTIYLRDSRTLYFDLFYYHDYGGYISCIAIGPYWSCCAISINRRYNSFLFSVMKIHEEITQCLPTYFPLYRFTCMFVNTVCNGYLCYMYGSSGQTSVLLQCVHDNHCLTSSKYCFSCFSVSWPGFFSFGCSGIVINGLGYTSLMTPGHSFLCPSFFSWESRGFFAFDMFAIYRYYYLLSDKSMSRVIRWHTLGTKIFLALCIWKIMNMHQHDAFVYGGVLPP